MAVVTDHPSGMPEVDVPGILYRLAGADEGWQCAVCLNLVHDDPEGSAWPAVTIANGSAVCAAHVEDAFGLEDKVRMQRTMRREARMAELRGKLGSP